MLSLISRGGEENRRETAFKLRRENPESGEGAHDSQEVVARVRYSAGPRPQRATG